MAFILLGGNCFLDLPHRGDTKIAKHAAVRSGVKHVASGLVSQGKLNLQSNPVLHHHSIQHQKCPVPSIATDIAA